MVFDSSFQTVSAGIRGGSNVRQLVLKVGDLDIHVQVSSERRDRELLGQIQPRGRNSAIHSVIAHLFLDGECIQSAAINVLGEFCFSDVPDGPLSLHLELAHVVVIAALGATNEPEAV
jgi:hypothetical protein